MYRLPLGPVHTSDTSRCDIASGETAAACLTLQSIGVFTRGDFYCSVARGPKTSRRQSVSLRDRRDFQAACKPLKSIDVFTRDAKTAAYGGVSQRHIRSFPLDTRSAITRRSIIFVVISICYLILPQCLFPTMTLSI